MIHKGKPYITVIKKSCLTGEPVWIYQGPEGGVRQAYWRACKKEIEYVQNFPAHVAECRANIRRLLDKCLESIPIGVELTDKQKAAAKRLLKLSKEEPTCHRAFYDHIMETRRRREEDHRIRLQMRERERLEREQKEREKNKQ